VALSEVAATQAIRQSLGKGYSIHLPAGRELGRLSFPCGYVHMSAFRPLGKVSRVVWVPGLMTQLPGSSKVDPEPEPELGGMNHAACP